VRQTGSMACTARANVAIVEIYLTAIVKACKCLVLVFGSSDEEFEKGEAQRMMLADCSVNIEVPYRLICRARRQSVSCINRRRTLIGLLNDVYGA
jgi:hypothetical protein